MKLRQAFKIVNRKSHIHTERTQRAITRLRRIHEVKFLLDLCHKLETEYQRSKKVKFYTPEEILN